MPRTAKALCYCGCGQAPSKTTRNRLIGCGCNLKVRVSREVMREAQWSCETCGQQLAPLCLEDAAQAGDDDAMAQLSQRISFLLDQAAKGRRGAEAKANRKAFREARDAGERIPMLMDSRNAVGGRFGNAREMRQAREEMPF